MAFYIESFNYSPDYFKLQIKNFDHFVQMNETKTSIINNGGILVNIDGLPLKFNSFTRAFEFIERKTNIRLVNSKVYDVPIGIDLVKFEKFTNLRNLSDFISDSNKINKTKVGFEENLFN